MRKRAYISRKNSGVSANSAAREPITESIPARSSISEGSRRILRRSGPPQNHKRASFAILCGDNVPAIRRRLVQLLPKQWLVRAAGKAEMA